MILPVPTPMLRMRLGLMSADAQVAVNLLARMEVLHPEIVEDPDERFDEWPAAQYHDAFHRLRSRYRKVRAFVEEALPEVEIERSSAVTVEELQQADVLVKRLWREISANEEKQRQLREQVAAKSQLLSSVQRFLSLDISLERLGRNSSFLNVVVGSVASANYDHLGRALSLSGHMIDRFFQGEGIDYVLIVGPAEQLEEVRELLKSADFRELPVPQEFSDHPQAVQQRLLDQQADLEKQIADWQQQTRLLISENRQMLADTGALLDAASPFSAVATNMKGHGSLVLLEGWAPAKQRQAIEQALHSELAHPCVIEFHEPAESELENVPTRLRSNWLIRPFNQLVGQFGLPVYGEIDPGVLFAFSYILMFGMMFGDIGHGAVIALGSLYLWRRFPAVGVIGTMAGISSACFGFVYGSLFGYEHVIHPLWMSPMEDPQLVLMLALVWGIGFLVIANLLAIRNAFAFGRRQQALFSPLGVTGLTFYLAVIGYLLVEYGSIGAPAILSPLLLGVLLVTMSMMLAYQWRQSSGKTFERVLMVAVEGLEIVINNISATLSFLRVAAFTLNHIALCAAVFAIAGMLDTFGHWVTVVLGNIFIIVLEGAIVAIQCLRLEYYEGFSRFFSGRGKPFKPLRVEPT